jgi:prophage maintenance system killer protein
MNLTKEDLILLHRYIQKLYKTIPGIRQEGILDAIIERPDLTLYGKEFYPDIYLKSASITEGIIRLHPFIDGNKRTGAANWAPWVFDKVKSLLSARANITSLSVSRKFTRLPEIKPGT